MNPRRLAFSISLKYSFSFEDENKRKVIMLLRKLVCQQHFLGGRKNIVRFETVQELRLSRGSGSGSKKQL